MSGTQVRLAAPASPTRGTLRPLGIDNVTITGGYWAERQAVNGAATLAHIRKYLELEGWIANFDMAAAGTLVGHRRGREFSDSEVYKYLEALAWEIGRTGREDLERDLREVVARVAAAQEADGYLDTYFGREGQGERWSDLEWGHELYCFGHLFQAAVARERTRPGADDGLLGIATRVADLVCATFGADGIQSVCGHAEIETGLAELARVTGNEAYLEQARLFVERRGNQVLRDIEWGRSYFQDDVPIREAVALRGHAVRANYLASGAIDVATETNDHGLVDALVSQWERTVARRTYITGGQGSRHQDEAFGDDWMLPNDRSYSETCAGVASIQFSWRLLLARGGAQYADLIERTLYNVVATSPSAEGTAFFYSNTLYQRRPGIVADSQAVSPRAESSLRAPWFEVSCCPPNVARTLASLAGYLATASDDGVQVHQFAASSVRVDLPDAGTVAFDVTTDYPSSGHIAVTITEAPSSPWTLSLRVPQWAAGALFRDGDGPAAEVAPGYAKVTKAFAVGDVVTLELPMAPRFTFPDDRIDATRGCVAIERGPEVLCLESVELVTAGLATVDDDLASIHVDTSVAPHESESGVVVVMAGDSEPARGWPYGDRATASSEAAAATREVALVPYRSWGNRGPSTMRVWIPTRA